ncbi:hypothetical protein, partial [Staphylococcus aureus]
YVQRNQTGKGRNGLSKDGYYIDDQDGPYTGAYGDILLEVISQMMQMIKESPFNDESQNDTALQSWIDVGFMPIIYKGEM